MFRKVSNKVRNQGKTTDKKTHLLFIDFSSAYNNINRERLYSTLERKRILSDESLERLKFIHDKVSIVMGEE